MACCTLPGSSTVTVAVPVFSIIALCVVTDAAMLGVAGSAGWARLAMSSSRRSFVSPAFRNGSQESYLYRKFTAAKTTCLAARHTGLDSSVTTSFPSGPFETTLFTSKNLNEVDHQGSSNGG